MRVVQVNLAADPKFVDPPQLLATYHTLTGWSDAVAGAGAAVHVVQRFSTDAVIQRHDTRYEFVQEGRTGMPAAWSAFPRLTRVVADRSPDVVHVNGLMFPGMLCELRRVLPRTCIVVQDHSGAFPRLAMWPFSVHQRARWRRAFRCANAFTFTAAALAERWRAVGLPRDIPALEIAEASTSLRSIDRDDARMMTGLRGSPCVLWVGRLDRNKDPLTVLAGLERLLPIVPGAQVTMIAPADRSRDAVGARIRASSTLRDRVSVIGPVAHSEMAAYYSAADVFISGSHHEGSGYALIEAMACGAIPCVTDIPAFRALTGDCGALWRPGDPDAFATAFSSLIKGDARSARQAVVQRFERALSWPAIGRQTVAAYSDVLDAMRVAC